MSNYLMTTLIHTSLMRHGQFINLMKTHVKKNSSYQYDFQKQRNTWIPCGFTQIYSRRKIQQNFSPYWINFLKDRRCEFLVVQLMTLIQTIGYGKILLGKICVVLIHQQYGQQDYLSGKCGRVFMRITRIQIRDDRVNQNAVNQRNEMDQHFLQTEVA